MAKLYFSFVDFNKKIKLSDDDRKKLLLKRDSLRKRMRENYAKLPADVRKALDMKFQSQGSYVMDTIIKPIKEDYDLDDGVYFLGDDGKEIRQTPNVFHEWVLFAIDQNEEYENINDKDTCVRVKYKDGSHIDLPMYYFLSLHPDLAHLKKGWMVSDPIEFIQWFEEIVKSDFNRKYLTEYATESANYKVWLNDIRKKDVQIRRIVRYLKAWADHIGGKMPCGLILTILTANHYSEHERDDISLRDTLFSIYDELSRNGIHCLRPTTPKDEDLFESTPSADKLHFYNSLKEFWIAADLAIKTETCQNARLLWSRHLGNRFTLSHDDKDQQIPSPPSKENLKPLITQRPWSPKI